VICKCDHVHNGWCSIGSLVTWHVAAYCGENEATCWVAPHSAWSNLWYTVLGLLKSIYRLIWWLNPENRLIIDDRHVAVHKLLQNTVCLRSTNYRAKHDCQLGRDYVLVVHPACTRRWRCVAEPACRHRWILDELCAVRCGWVMVTVRVVTTCPVSQDVVVALGMPIHPPRPWPLQCWAKTNLQSPYPCSVCRCPASLPMHVNIAAQYQQLRWCCGWSLLLSNV